MEYFISANEIAIHLSDSGGEGENIILLHGYLETLYIWEEFTPLLSDHFRVISLDLPGHGLTGSYSINSMERGAETIIAMMDNLQIEQGWLIGHSMGGYIALEAIDRYRDRFRGVIMLNSTPFKDSVAKMEQREREILLIRENRLQAIVQQSIEKMFAPNNRAKFEEKILEIIEVAEIHDPEAIASSIEGIKEREDKSQLLAQALFPLLFIFGKEDNYLSNETIEEIKERVGESAIYKILEQTGHSSFIEAPKQTAEIIINFIKEKSNG